MVRILYETSFYGAKKFEFRALSDFAHQTFIAGDDVFFSIQNTQLCMISWQSLYQVYSFLICVKVLKVQLRKMYLYIMHSS